MTTYLLHTCSIHPKTKDVPNARNLIQKKTNILIRKLSAATVNIDSVLTATQIQPIALICTCVNGIVHGQ